MAKAAATKKAPFGGFQLSFKGISASLEEVMGDKPIPPSQMTKKLWDFVKAKRLALPR